MKNDAEEKMVSPASSGLPGKVHRKNARLPVKLALLTQILPPAPFYGGVVLLYRILKDLNPDDYCLIADRSYESGAPPDGLDSTPRLPARYHYLRFDPMGSKNSSDDEPKSEDEDSVSVAKLESDSKPRMLGYLRSKVPGRLKRVVQWIFTRAWTVWWTVSRWWVLREAHVVFRRVRGTARVVRQERCGAIVACSQNPFDLPVGYLASRLARVPFYAYLMDDYRSSYKATPYQRFVRIAEPMCVRGAAGVIVLNEFVRDEYRRRYRGVEPVIVRNAFEVPEIDGAEDAGRPLNKDEVGILYTGTVYHAHHDAFRNLLAALQSFDPPGAKLYLRGTQTREELAKVSVGGPDVALRGHLASSEVFEELRRADILFLPLAFDSHFPELIRTSCPMKTGEYLASGRPILVHAPAGSFLDWYFTRHECGVVVSERDPKMLAEAIRRIRDNAELRERIGRNARARALADFDLEPAREAFVETFLMRSDA